MSIRTRLQEDLHTNMKARNELETTVLRSVLGAVSTAEKSGKQAVTFTDEQVEAEVKRAVKTRKESAGIYRDAGAADRAEREQAEADFLSTYLPDELTVEQVEVLVDEVLAGFEAPTQRDFGAIMKAVITASKGATDGKTVSAIVKSRLG